MPVGKHDSPRGRSKEGRHSVGTIALYEPKDQQPDRLSRRHHDILLLDAAGKKYREIADHLAVPVGTVRSNLHRARAHLDALVAADKARNAQPPAGLDGDDSEPAYG